jgi:hypothetical protein
MARNKKYGLAAALTIFLLNTIPVLCYDLTGVWQANAGGGYYYFRQEGSQVWWLGEQSDSSPNWCNVAYGMISGDTIKVNWADVPKGNIMNHGKLTIQILSDNALQIVGNPAPFGATSFSR